MYTDNSLCSSGAAYLKPLLDIINIMRAKIFRGIKPNDNGNDHFNGGKQAMDRERDRESGAGKVERNKMDNVIADKNQIEQIIVHSVALECDVPLKSPNHQNLIFIFRYCLLFGC